MESRLENVMATLVAVFHKYSCAEGDKYKLNNNELKKLIKNELQIQNPEKMDLDGDGEVDFQEFVLKVAQETISKKCPKSQQESAKKKQPAKKASDLETAIQTLEDVFNEYASKDGKKDSLSKSGLKSLIQKELSLDNVDKPEKLEELFSDLDANGDGVVDFEEFIIMFALLTIICNMFFEEILKDEQK